MRPLPSQHSAVPIRVVMLANGLPCTSPSDIDPPCRQTRGTQGHQSRGNKHVPGVAVHTFFIRLGRHGITALHDFCLELGLRCSERIGIILRGFCFCLAFQRKSFVLIE